MSDNKSAIITGSSSGIGLGIAKALAASGVNVVLNGIEPPEQIEQTLDDIRNEHGVQAIYCNANLMTADGAEELVSRAREAFGRVDIMVNNAGIQHVAPVEEFPAGKWDAILALNLSSAFHTMRHVIAEMKAQQWGRIINVASAHGLVASPYKSAYVAAKHGVLGLTKTVALEVAEYGITVNAICPGYVWTPLVEKQIPDTAKARNMTEEQVVKEVLLKAQPNKKFATVEEIGALAVFLCSDAATSMTGGAISIDGGWVAQ